MRKRVYIIHGWEGYPEEGWFPWLKNELEKKGFQVVVPTMPNTMEPKIETWVPFLKELIGTPDEHTYLVGHSIGCQTVLRYLSDLDGDVKLGGIVLVAGWVLKLTTYYSEDEVRIAKPWIETPINFENIRNHVKSIVAIFSDNDEFVSLDNIDLFKEKLGAETVLERNKGHFSGGDGLRELPIVLEKILNF